MYIDFYGVYTHRQLQFEGAVYVESRHKDLATCVTKCNHSMYNNNNNNIDSANSFLITATCKLVCICPEMGI